MSAADEATGWHVTAVEHHRGTEWVLLALGDGTELGRVDANGTAWFIGDYDRAAELWQAFSGQR